jgi:cytochrome b6-f complex iron-sulfur subunit
MPDASRRDFLKLTTTFLLSASGLIGLAGLIRFLDFQPGPAPRTDFDVGLDSTFPPGSQTVIPEVPALLTHNPDGFTALSLICTHLGCTVWQDTDTNGLTCPCHGSRFEENGKVLQGPAKKPLATLRVELTADGHLVVHTA